MKVRWREARILGAEVPHWLNWAGDYFLWEIECMSIPVGSVIDGFFC